MLTMDIPTVTHVTSPKPLYDTLYHHIVTIENWMEGSVSARWMTRNIQSHEEKGRTQLVMHVASEDHRMNVTDSENGKYHQCSKIKETRLTTDFFRVRQRGEGKFFFKFITTRRPRGVEISVTATCPNLCFLDLHIKRLFIFSLFFLTVLPDRSSFLVSIFIDHCGLVNTATLL